MAGDRQLLDLTPDGWMRPAGDDLLILDGRYLEASADTLVPEAST